MSDDKDTGEGCAICLFMAVGFLFLVWGFNLPAAIGIVLVALVIRNE